MADRQYSKRNKPIEGYFSFCLCFPPFEDILLQPFALQKTNVPFEVPIAHNNLPFNLKGIPDPMNTKYFKSSCQKCNWNLTVRQSPDEFCIRPSGLFRFLSNKVPKVCPKCGSELKTNDASFFDYASPIEWGGG